MKPSRAETGYGYIKYSKESEYSKENERLNLIKLLRLKLLLKNRIKKKQKSIY